MCEARDAIRARKQAADGLAKACAERAGCIASAFMGVLAEPIPEALRKLVAQAERSLKR